MLQDFHNRIWYSTRREILLPSDYDYLNWPWPPFAHYDHYRALLLHSENAEGAWKWLFKSMKVI